MKLSMLVIYSGCIVSNIQCSLFLFSDIVKNYRESPYGNLWNQSMLLFIFIQFCFSIFNNTYRKEMEYII